MKRRRHLLLCGACLILSAWCAHRVVPGAEPGWDCGIWRGYQVYQPDVENRYVVNPATSPLQYNHDSAVAWFRDRWYCLWNANTVRYESRPGQLNYMSTSTLGYEWSEPVACFADDRYATPAAPAPTGTQWQPAVIVVNDELWAFWENNTSDSPRGCHFSRLRNPGEKWINRRLEWNAGHKVDIGGTLFRPFPTQNAFQMSTGRVLVPVTLIGPRADDAPSEISGFQAAEKRDSVIWSDDGGDTWHCSPGCIQPGRSWAQWEPTVWELPDGRVMMFARNNYYKAVSEGGDPPTKKLTWSISDDGGETWTPHDYVPIETVASRMHVLPMHEFGAPSSLQRWIMIHNDNPADRFVHDRLYASLYFSRSGRLDFTAGINVTGQEPFVMYPQMWVHGDRMLISYSQGNSPRGIKIADVSPLPEPGKHYILPRGNLPPNEAPVRVDNAYRFFGNQWIATNDAFECGTSGFSFGAWVHQASQGHVILDNRDAGGFVIALNNDRRPFVWAGTPEHNMNSTATLQAGWNYIGVSFDNVNGRLSFRVNATTETHPFTAPSTRDLTGTTGHIGYKRVAGSVLTGFNGDLRFVGLYPDTLLDDAGHNWVHDRFAAELGMATLGGGSEPSTTPTLWMDPADETAFNADFTIPTGGFGSIAITTSTDRTTLSVSGEASAGVDLPENHRDRGDGVRVQFDFKVHNGDDHVILTTGDANEYWQVEHRSGSLLLTSGTVQQTVGPVAFDTWHTLDVLTWCDTTRVSLDGGAPVSIAGPQPEATWVYLGMAYRTETIPGDNSFSVHVESLRTRADQAAKLGVSVPWPRYR